MHVVVNAAMSADGKLSSRRREQISISGESDFDRVDRLRADRDAVVVGVGTVLADDPRLTVKDDALCEQRRTDGQSPNPLESSSTRKPARQSMLLCSQTRPKPMSVSARPLLSGDGWISPITQNS